MFESPGFVARLDDLAVMSDAIEKRGGVRVIYLLRTKAGQILLIAIYKKAVKENLTDKERVAIRTLVEEIENG